ncbi:MAG: lycopene cyclase domain-containing protein, partial [Nitrosopumilus sp.]|nr:lycopene cyclase domain-containing protein [Nitrosopumilus sp.]
MMWTYLLINFFAVIIPVVFSFHPKLNFYKNWKYFFLANLVISAIFIAWDMLFTHWGIWGFIPKYLIGINIINLPLEEVLFFIFIPFSCLFTYHCFQVLFNFNSKKKTIDLIVFSFSSILFFTGILNLDKIYTSTTFISLSIV